MLMVMSGLLGLFVDFFDLDDLDVSVLLDDDDLLDLIILLFGRDGGSVSLVEVPSVDLDGLAVGLLLHNDLGGIFGLLKVKGVLAVDLVEGEGVGLAEVDVLGDELDYLHGQAVSLVLDVLEEGLEGDIGRKVLGEGAGSGGGVERSNGERGKLVFSGFFETEA
jgi:hypothetical protein